MPRPSARAPLRRFPFINCGSPQVLQRQVAVSTRVITCLVSFQQVHELEAPANREAGRVTAERAHSVALLIDHLDQLEALCGSFVHAVELTQSVTIEDEHKQVDSAQWLGFVKQGIVAFMAVDSHNLCMFDDVPLLDLAQKTILQCRQCHKTISQHWESDIAALHTRVEASLIPYTKEEELRLGDAAPTPVATRMILSPQFKDLPALCLALDEAIDAVASATQRELLPAQFLASSKERIQ